MAAMTDLQTTIHNIPPASVAQRLRGRYQWAAYQALAAAAGGWVDATDLLEATYGGDSNAWDAHKALKSVLARLRVKGIPVQTYYVPNAFLRYRLPLDWQRAQDAAEPDGGSGEEGTP